MYVYLLIYIFGRVKETIYIKTCKIKAHRSTCKIHKLVDRLHANYKNCITKSVLYIQNNIANSLRGSKKTKPQKFYLYYHDQSFLYLWVHRRGTNQFYPGKQLPKHYK